MTLVPYPIFLQFGRGKAPVIHAGAAVWGTVWRAPFLVWGRGYGERLTRCSHWGTITTMTKKSLNPNIRVTAETRKTLKIIAAHTGETIVEVVARLAKQELERLKKQEV